MKIGLIDVDGHNFPNLPLMKISAWHKAKGDYVEWYNHLVNSYDTVYMSKVFSFTEDFKYPIHAKKVVKGGSGYCINVVNGVEVYDKTKDIWLPNEIEHIYPDYSLYPDKTKDTAYGFLTRGCPRGCSFCHVEAKEGRKSYKVADLSEFWRGQKNIVLCDPNLTGCSEWKDLLQQLIDSNALVEFNQGLDIRLLNSEKIEMLNRIKVKRLHFAWDRYQDKDTIVPKFKEFIKHTNLKHYQLIVYVLCNFDTTHEQDLERIYTLRDMGYDPYVAIYNKSNTRRSDLVRRLQRWCNNRWVFKTCSDFKNYGDLSDYNKDSDANKKKLF